MNMNRFIAPRITGAASLLMLAAQVRAVTPEPENLPTVGPMGGIIFGVIFVGFCVVVVWMMMKQKGPEQDQDKE